MKKYYILFIMENNIKGYLYEELIKNYIINDLDKQAYLWSFTPENILIKNKEVDIILESNE